MTEMKRVAIVGATGYAGSELTGILARHRNADVVALFNSGGSAAPANAAYPELIAQPFAFDALVDAKPEVVFLATPNEASAELAPKLLDQDMRVIDLSGAFRLSDPALYPQWYGFTHEKPALLDQAVYGQIGRASCRERV